MPSSSVFVEPQSAVVVVNYVEEFDERVRLEVCGSILESHDMTRSKKEIGNCMAVSPVQ